MSIVSLADVKPAKKLRQELLADCTALKSNCDIDCRGCVDEVTDYLMGCFEEE